MVTEMDQVGVILVVGCWLENESDWLLHRVCVFVVPNLWKWESMLHITCMSDENVYEPHVKIINMTIDSWRPEGDNLN